MKFPSLLLTLWLLAYVNCQTSEDQREKAVENTSRILTDLYLTIRNIVFPKSPLQTGNKPTSNRFVLMSPGKVLNYWDYYPGPDYEESLLRQNSSAPEEVVPPSVMEKWFDIADVMVGADPFTGGITAKSMARSYETIIAQMKLLGLERKSADAKKKYDIAKGYLTSPIPDPDNLTQNTTRLSLYDRFQNEYSDKKLEMEEKINKVRTTRGYIEYELWFQRNYPSLNSKVESAYMKWLTFGEKDLVELYKTYLDTASSGVELGEARMALRASRVQSLDRTRTIYPVSFEPGNWFKYLLPKQRPISRDMLIARKSMLESELSALTSMIKFNNQNKEQANETTRNLKSKLDNATNISDNKTQEASSAMYKCMNENAQQQPPTPRPRGKKGSQNPAGSSSPTTTAGSSTACQNYKQANGEAVTATFNQAQVKSEYENAAFLLNTKGQYNNFLQVRASSLESQISSIEAQLNESKPYLGGIADSRKFKDLNSIFNETEQSLDDAWTAFEYESDSSHITSEQETETKTVATSFGVGGLGWGVQGSAQYGEGTADLKQSLNSANLKVSGELLRVTIKRPWFRPSLFLNPSFSFIQRDKTVHKNTYVSPGPQSDMNLRDSISNIGSSNYLLPEYVTSFLLARDVKLQFSGVDSNTVSHSMQMMAGGSFSGSYGMFSASASFGYSKDKQSVTADRTANGMIITIPGAQIIGYYTEVLPRFPQTQNN